MQNQPLHLMVVVGGVNKEVRMNPFEKKLNLKEMSKVRNANGDTKKKYTLPVLKMKSDEGYKPTYTTKTDTSKDSNLVKGLLGFLQGTLAGTSASKTIEQKGNTKNLDYYTGKENPLTALLVDKVASDEFKKNQDVEQAKMKALDISNKDKIAAYSQEDAPFNLNAYNIGNTLGNMADFAVGYGAFGGKVDAITKPLLSKLGTTGAKGLGSKIASEMAKDLAIGSPMNYSKAKQQGLEGKDMAENMAWNTLLDLGTNGLIEGASQVVKLMKVAKATNNVELGNAVVEQVIKDNPEVAQVLKPEKIVPTTSTLRDVKQPLPVLKNVESTITKPVIETKFKQGDTVEFSTGEQIKVKRIENDNYIVDVNGQEGNYPINAVDNLDGVKTVKESKQVYRYHTTQRPPSPGTIPKGSTNVKSFDSKLSNADINSNSWGYAEYDRPLTKAEISDYELTPMDMRSSKGMTMEEWDRLDELEKYAAQGDVQDAIVNDFAKENYGKSFYYETSNGGRVMISPSTRDGVDFQATYFNNKSQPTSHRDINDVRELADYINENYSLKAGDLNDIVTYATGKEKWANIDVNKTPKNNTPPPVSIAPNTCLSRPFPE